jgi:sugar phosphate permease
MLKNKRVIIAVASAIAAMIFMLFFESILSEHLDQNMHINSDYLGYFFALLCISYGLSAFLVVWLSKKMKRRYLTQCSFILTSVALFCFGPSKMLHFPSSSLTLTIFGLILLGLSSALTFVPLLTELIESIQI